MIARRVRGTRLITLLFVVGLNLLGDGMRDVLDPRGKDWR